jgi:hypothetical protein
MNIKYKRLFNFFTACLLIILLLPQNTLVTNAASNAKVYGYSPMLEDSGNIYYIETVEGSEKIYNIYRLEVSTGNKTKLLSSKNDISNMIIHNEALYYTSYDQGIGVNRIYSLSLDTKDNKVVCNGSLLALDDNSIYYTVIAMKGEGIRFYKRNYNSKTATLIYTGNTSFNFVKKLDDTLYFTQFKEASSKLATYELMPEQTKLTVLTTDKITLDGTEKAYPIVSDIIKINGDIYYQYGTFQGSGYYWYGTLLKLDSSTNKKSIITEQTYEEKLDHNDSSIFWNYIDSSEAHYKYNTKTGKTSNYVYKTTGSESFNIIGDKSYCAKADGKGLITVSRFTSGTNKANLKKSFIKISYKQNKKYDYSADVIKYGDYLLIPVTGIDYNAADYGWRGKTISVTWFVADTDGKMLTQFQ